jgi:formylmethanofuran dehydrogenase subunit C
VTGLRLVLRQAPSLRVDARALQPAALAARSADDVRRLRLAHGRDEVELGEWFDVRVEDGATAGGDEGGPALVIEGALDRFDAIGAGLAEGTLVVEGSVGDAAGLGMRGGRLEIRGSARDLAGAAMRGGTFEVRGDVGDFAAGALAGDLDGMRGGTLVVRGRAGARIADRMRRGTVVVHGDVGDLAASRLVAGTLALGGQAGAHAGCAQRRGSVVFARGGATPGATFVQTQGDVGVAWQLLARDLARFGGVFSELPRRRMMRFVGDLAVDGLGEWLVAP